MICKSHIKVQFHNELWPIRSNYCINRWARFCVSISSSDAAGSCLGKLICQSTGELKPAWRRGGRNTLSRSPLSTATHGCTLNQASVQTGPIITVIAEEQLPCASLSPASSGKQYTIWMVEMTRFSYRGQRRLLFCQTGPLSQQLTTVEGLGSVSQLLHPADSPIPRYCQNSPKMLPEFWGSALKDLKEERHQTANSMWNILGFLAV